MSDVAVTFAPTRAETLAAYRLHHRPDRKQMVLTVFVVVVVALALFAMTDKSMANLANSVVTAVGSSVLVLVVLWFVVLPGQVRRVYAQQRNVDETVTLEWDDAGLRARTARGRVAMAWGDYVERRENAALILLCQSDSVFQFIPRRVLSAEQSEALAAYIAGIPTRR